MVSPALSQWLERARVQFGLEVEILDAGLNSVYPEGGTNLSRIIQDSPAVRRTLLDAVAGGHPERLDGDSGHYRLYPLRGSRARRPAAGLLAIKRASSDVLAPKDAEPWSDLARAIVEADLAAGDTLGQERQRSRRLVGVLRFLESLAAANDEKTLTHALLHAAAIWYDVDARIYRRTSAGHFRLHAHLPGVEPDPASLVLPADLISDGVDILRLVSASDLGETGAGHDAMLVALTASRRADWALALIGHVSTEAEGVLRLLGRVAGVQFASQATRRGAEARARFEALLTQKTKAPELVVMHVLRDLVEMVNASSGSVALTTRGQSRRIAAIGAAGLDARAAETTDSRSSTDRFVCALAVGADEPAVLELHAVPGTEFTADGVMVAQACAAALRTWIAGSLSSFDAAGSVLEGTPVAQPAFSARIQEELARANRFDLRLSLILIDVTAPSSTVAQLQEALRRELRGSDVTGAMSGTQVAILLTHTDAMGLENVVRRLKQRLADAAEGLNVSHLRLGQAALSPECRTADALLELALRRAEPVTVH